MKGIVIAAAGAAVLLGGAAAPAAVKPANDVGIRMKVASGNTVSPLATLTVKNLGTNVQNGVSLEVHAESGKGLLLWSGTVDLLPGGSAVVKAHLFLDQDTTALAATAVLAGAADEDPSDNTARAGLGLAGKPGLVLVGRAIHLAYCASCHGQGAGGQGGAPTLVGATAPVILAKAAAGGTHAFPWLSKTDAKDLSLFLADPAAAVMPPSLPKAPPGGWPTWAGEVGALLGSRCATCHGPALAGGGVRLDSLAFATKNAVRALLAVQIGRMPKSGAGLSASEIALLQDWITGGMRP